MIEVYRVFSRDWSDFLDYSDEAAVALFENESRGVKSDLSLNGFAVGKQWLSVHVEMWKEDILSGLLDINELYEDESLPEWWLDSIFKIDYALIAQQDRARAS